MHFGANFTSQNKEKNRNGTNGPEGPAAKRGRKVAENDGLLAEENGRQNMRGNSFYFRMLGQAAVWYLVGLGRILLVDHEKRESKSGPKNATKTSQ